MKKIVCASLLLIIFGIAFSQDYKPVDEGSSVKFKIKNFGFNTGGKFSGLQGTIHFDKDNPSASSFDVSINANSVNTDNEMRDNHLREESYFDVKKYPTIHFISTSVKAGKENSFEITGKLTIKDKSHDINFPFTITQSTDGYIFNGEFKISRKDYGVGGSNTISDNVIIDLTVVAKK
ncbi:MAG TPA: YceI family protein [Puia sp.]